MIYLRLAGGLGNQLYQLAAASLLSHSTAEQIPVIPLTEGLTRYDEPREADSIKLLEPNGWLLGQDVFVSRQWKALALEARAGRWMPFIGISDRNFWQAVSRGVGRTCLIDGYFQFGWTPDSFYRALSKMPIKAVLDSVASRASNQVVIHIRGGDFLRIREFNVVDEKYYVKAITQALERGYKSFEVVSDDKQYAEKLCDKICQLLSTIDITLLPPANSALEDFDVIRNASARIIGNSTFAWWAAALGSRESLTWSPNMFTSKKPRDFFLPFELPLEILSDRMKSL